MEEALVAYLLAQAGPSAMVSDRITWARRGQGKPLPAVVLYRIDGAPDYHLGGASGLVSSRVQVDCWANTFGDAKRTARAVAIAVSGMRFNQGAIRFDALLIIDERDSSEDLNGTPLFRTSLDLAVHHASAS